MAKKIRKDTTSKTAAEIMKVALKERKFWGLRSSDTDEMFSAGIVVFLAENFSDDCLTPDGLPDGDMPHRHTPYVPLHEMETCDISGNPISPEKMCLGDFHPDHIEFLEIDETFEDFESDDSIEDEDDDDDFDRYEFEMNHFYVEKFVEVKGITVNGDALSESAADEIWDRYIWRDPLEDSLSWEELRLELKDEEETSLFKMGSMAPGIACRNDGTRLVKIESGGRYRIPKPDHHKDHRVKISRRQAEKINNFIGDDFCHHSIFGARVAITFGHQPKRRFEKPVVSPVVFSALPAKTEKEKTVKKPDNKGYFNRRAAMARR